MKLEHEAPVRDSSEKMDPKKADTKCTEDSVTSPSNGNETAVECQNGVKLSETIAVDSTDKRVLRSRVSAGSVCAKSESQNSSHNKIQKNGVAEDGDVSVNGNKVDSLSKDKVWTNLSGKDAQGEEGVPSSKEPIRSEKHANGTNALETGPQVSKSEKPKLEQKPSPDDAVASGKHKEAPGGGFMKEKKAVHEKDTDQDLEKVKKGDELTLRLESGEFISVQLANDEEAQSVGDGQAGSDDEVQVVKVESKPKPAAAIQVSSSGHSVIKSIPRVPLPFMSTPVRSARPPPPNITVRPVMSTPLSTGAVIYTAGPSLIGNPQVVRTGQNVYLPVQYTQPVKSTHVTLPVLLNTPINSSSPIIRRMPGLPTASARGPIKMSTSVLRPQKPVHPKIDPTVQAALDMFEKAKKDHAKKVKEYEAVVTFMNSMRNKVTPKTVVNALRDHLKVPLAGSKARTNSICDQSSVDRIKSSSSSEKSECHVSKLQNGGTVQSGGSAVSVLGIQAESTNAEPKQLNLSTSNDTGSTAKMRADFGDKLKEGTGDLQKANEAINGKNSGKDACQDEPEGDEMESGNAMECQANVERQPKDTNVLEQGVEKSGAGSENSESEPVQVETKTGSNRSVANKESECDSVVSAGDADGKESSVAATSSGCDQSPAPAESRDGALSKSGTSLAEDVQTVSKSDKPTKPDDTPVQTLQSMLTSSEPEKSGNSQVLAGGKLSESSNTSDNVQLEAEAKDTDKENHEEAAKKLRPVARFLYFSGLDLAKEYIYKELTDRQEVLLDKKKLDYEEEIDFHRLRRTYHLYRRKNRPLHPRLKKCKSCSFQTESLSVMHLHHELGHLDASGKYECALCDFETRVPLTFKVHMEADHNMVGRMQAKPAFWQCPLCNFEQSSKGALSKHRVRCEKKFSVKKHLFPTYDDINYLFRALTGPSLGPNPALTPPILPKPAIAPKPNVFRSNEVSADPRPSSSAQTTKITYQLNSSQPAAPRIVTKPSVRPGTVSSFPSVLNNTLAKQLAVPATSPSDLNVKKSGGKRPAPSPSKGGPNAKVPRSDLEICEICGGYIKDRTSLRLHFMMAHCIEIDDNVINAQRSPPLSCDICSEKFWTFQGLTMHRVAQNHIPITNTKTLGNKCFICGVFVSDIRKHIDGVHNMIPDQLNKIRICPVCGANLSPGNMMNHLKNLHSIELPPAADKANKFHCPNCKKAFPSIFDINQHIMQFHSYKCAKCSFRCNSLEAYKAHESRGHKKGKKQCLICKQLLPPSLYNDHVVKQHIRKMSVVLTQCDNPVKSPRKSKTRRY